VHGKESAKTMSTMDTSTMDTTKIVPDLFGSIEASMRELGFVEVKDYFAFATFPSKCKPSWPLNWDQWWEQVQYL